LQRDLPGATLTPHARKLVAQRMLDSGKSEAEATRDYLAQRQPSKRFVDPQDVGHLAVFLCSDAAKEMTGGPVAIDGVGWLFLTRNDRDRMGYLWE